MFENEATRDSLMRTIGKTIANVEYGSLEGAPNLHQGQIIVYHFTDGSSTSTITGTNAGNCCEEPTDLRVELTVIYHKPGEECLWPVA